MSKTKSDTSPSKYRVTDRGSFIGPTPANQIHYRPGMVFEPGKGDHKGFTEKIVRTLLDEGQIVPHTEFKSKVELPPQEVAVVGEEGISAPKARRTAVKHKSPWSEDPGALEGKSLDELNLLIIEKDPSSVPMETPEEARAWLSQDFKP